MNRLLLEQQRTHHIFEKEKLSIINATPEEMHRIAEVNPKLFGTKYTRWGCQFKCVKCNGYRVHTGGIRSLLQISRIVNEQKYEHRKSCKHPKWEETWSLHAAEIAHTFVEMTTARTQTGDTDWTDITGAVITSGNFTASRKYLLINKALCGTNSTAADHGLRSLHGSIHFVESVQIQDLPGFDRFHNNMWFNVWTAIASEAIKMQFATLASSSHTVSVDTISMISMEISEDLIEGTDWDFHLNTHNTPLTTTFGSFANVTIQPAVHDTGDTYWVLGYAKLDPASATQDYQSRLNRSGEATSTNPTWSQEGEDANTDHSMHTYGRTFDLGASNNTFTVQCRNPDLSNGFHEFSGVFVLNLERFKDSNEIYTDGAVNLGTTNWADLAQTLTLTPTEASGDVLIYGFFTAIHQFVSGVQIQSRLQIDNADQPPGQSSYLVQAEAYDNNDEMGQNLITVETLDNTLHTADIDADATSLTNSPQYAQRQLVMFTMELAPGNIKKHPSTTLPLRGEKEEPLQEEGTNALIKSEDDLYIRQEEIA